MFFVAPFYFFLTMVLIMFDYILAPFYIFICYFFVDLIILKGLQYISLMYHCLPSSDTTPLHT